MPWKPSIVLASLAGLAACAQPVAPQTGGPGAPAQGDGPSETGRIAYQRACAACHERGSGGAPRTGRAEDWAGRSRLWDAVLVEHAKKGYFDMPAKGGDVTLSDEDVQAAAEHMLTLTHPQVPAG